MPKICYRQKKFNLSAKASIVQANEIIDEYESQGFNLTLRQLYYQFVARDLIPNSQKSYKNLGSLINEARLAGLIDWNAIVDRTREVSMLSTWEDPSHIVQSCAAQFRLDAWKSQPNYVEVWIEKDALVGVIEGICDELRVPFLSCRGYTSQSSMWLAAMRLRRKRDDEDKEVHILHFGDHDPSGCDMSRDIQERLEEFSEGSVNFKRMALNMKQIKKYRPPPNPAKITDTRSGAYIEEHGHESWELDALEPKVIARLIKDEIYGLRDAGLWERSINVEDGHKADLEIVGDHWNAAVSAVQRYK